MKLKRFFKRGLQKAISNDFKNLVEDKSMAMPSGFLCYRYWDDGSELTKRYYFVVNFAGSTRNCFTFECAWQPDVETDIVNSNGWPKSLSDDDGCLRIIYLDPKFLPPPINPSEYILKPYEEIVNYDYWWNFEKINEDEPDLMQLDCILQDAIEKLGKLVMPFFRDLAAFHAGQPMSSNLMTVEQKMTRNNSTDRWDDANGTAWNRKEWICQKDKLKRAMKVRRKTFLQKQCRHTIRWFRPLKNLSMTHVLD